MADFFLYTNGTAGQIATFGVGTTFGASSGDDCIIRSAPDGKFIIMPNGTATQELTSTVPGSSVEVCYDGINWYVIKLTGVWSF